MDNKASQQLIKEANIKLVFSLIHKNKKISRADIKKITRLSATTVSTLVEELMTEGFVEECGIKDTKSSGRKAVILKVNSDGGFFIGLDVQKTRIEAACYGLDFTLAEKIELPVITGENLGMSVMHAVGRLSGKRRILGVTIGLPGVIDPLSNTLTSSTVMAAEDAKDIYSTLKEALPDVDIYLKNNSGLIALAEKEFGNHEKPNNLISVDIDDGVGAGILIDGAIYDGSGMAGEFGHISVDFNGKRCKCGSFGCLELYSSMPAILDATNTKSASEIKKLSGAKEKEALLKSARALAFGINNIINLLDPELIVIGGSVREMGEAFLAPVRECFGEISLMKNKKIVYSTLKENPVALGGARYSFDKLFSI